MLLALYHSRHKANPWWYCHIYLNTSLSLFPVPAHKHFTVWLQCDSETSGEDSLQVSTRQNSLSLTLRSQPSRQPMNHPLIAESFLFTQLQLPSLISSQHKDGGAITNLLSHFLCLWSCTALFFSSLTLPLTVFFWQPPPSFFLLSSPCRHVMFRSTVQRISFPPVSI